MISIIGSGKIGSNVALHVALHGLDDITLVDVVKGLPQGEAADLMHMLSAYGSDIQVKGSNDFSSISGSDLVIVAAGFGRKPGQTRLDLMNSNAGIIHDVVKQIKNYAPHSVLMMVTNPLDVMTYIAYKVSGFPRNRVVGMSGTLDGARLRGFIAQKLGVSVASVEPMIIGEHGENMLPVPNYTTVGGIPCTKFMSSSEFETILKLTRGVAAEVIAAKGATIHGPAAAVTVLADAIVNDRKKVLNASTYLDGEYGYKDIVMDVPIIASATGVEKIIEIDLDKDEKNELQKSYSTLREAIARLSPDTIP